MRMIKTTLLIIFPLLLAGCSTITNLTPKKQDRNASGLYPVEMAWKSREQAIRKQTIAPQVVVGMETYPMKPTLLVKDRWETLVPIPDGETSVQYRFKVNYEYNAIPAPRKNSKLSPEYKLQVTEKK